MTSPRPVVRGVLLSAGIFLALLALAVALQVASGAFHSEFASYPDEPAHYVTSLMVREYITGPHPLNPLQFAKDYYNHYPKVAFGHWPPVFYLIQAFWMLLFSPSRAAVRLEVAFTTAVLAMSLWRLLRKSFGIAPATLGAALLICLPLVQASTDQEMAEMLLVLFCFWSALCFARYLESASYTDSLWFALFFSLGVLTKGSAWLLALIPPLAMLLTGKLHFLSKRSFWLSVLVVALLCLPWQIVTLQSAERGWTGGSHPSVGYTLTSLGQFLQILVAISGPLLSVLILLGIIVTVVTPLLRRSVQPVPAVLVALLLADWVFHSLVPAGVEDRKMIIAVPALIFFLFSGGIWLADRLPFPKLAVRGRRALVAAAGLLIFFVQVFFIPRSISYGYISAARHLTSDPKLQGRTVLVSSESGGEGLLISEVAMLEPRPKDTIIRGTKDLARVDWNGSNYQSLFSNTQDLVQHLEKCRINIVVVDSFSPQQAFPHNQLLARTIHENPDLFRLLWSIRPVAKVRGQIDVYQFDAGSPKS